MIESKMPDDWPSDSNKISDASHVHAIGQFALMYNALEEMFGFVWQCCFPANGDYSESLFHNLNNRQRVDMLAALSRFGEKDKGAQEFILYALRCFDICTDNRNTMLHAIKEHSSTADSLRLSKRAKNNPARTAYYELPLATLRRVADETAATLNLWVDLFLWLEERRVGQNRPLPDRPPQPYRLSPSPQIATDADAPHPPQPSAP